MGSDAASSAFGLPQSRPMPAAIEQLRTPPSPSSTVSCAVDWPTSLPMVSISTGSCSSRTSFVLVTRKVTALGLAMSPWSTPA